MNKKIHNSIAAITKPGNNTKAFQQKYRKSVVYSHNGILYSSQNEPSTAESNNTNLSAKSNYTSSILSHTYILMTS